MGVRLHDQRRVTGPAGNWPLGIDGNIPALDIDFVNGRALVDGVFYEDRDVLSVTRASAGYAQSADGLWLPFSSGVRRRTTKGLLVEEARTNEIRNNSMQGASAPSTLPTNWSLPLTSGLSQQIVGIGTENGVDYIDVRLFGTTSGGSENFLFETASGVIAAANGEVWTPSVFLALVGGDFTNVTAIKQSIYMRSAVPAYLGVVQGADIASSISASLQRFTPSGLTLNQASTAWISSGINFAFNNPAAVDFTIRIGWPQAEEGAFATSPIRTTTAAATRAIDLDSSGQAITTGFTVFYEGTLIADPSGVWGTFCLVDDGTTGNEIMFHESAGAFRVGIRSGASDIASLSGGTCTVGTKYKAALVCDDDDVRLYVDGNSIGTPITSVTLPTGLDSIRWGARSNGAAVGCSLTERTAIIPSALSAAQAQALTT